MNKQQRRFERKRLELFEARGVSMEPRWVKDHRERQTYVLDSEGEGVPLVMIHGGGSQAAEWCYLAGRLADRRRLLVVDRPGCGLSSPVDYGGVDVRRSAAQWLEGLFENLDVDRADVIANSMGAYFALSYLLDETQDRRVRRLVLAGAPAGLDRWMPYSIRSMAIPGLNRLVFALAGEADIDMMRAFHRRLLVERTDRLSEAYLEVMAEGAQLPGAQLGWRTLLEELLSVGGFRTRYMLRDEVSSIEIPTLFVWGEEDAFASPESGERVAKRMSAAEFVRIEGAGHLCWIDDPDRVTRAVGGFLEASEREDVTVPPGAEPDKPRPGTGGSERKRGPQR